MRFIHVLVIITDLVIIYSSSGTTIRLIPPVQQRRALSRQTHRPVVSFPLLFMLVDLHVRVELLHDFILTRIIVFPTRSLFNIRTRVYRVKVVGEEMAFYLCTLTFFSPSLHALLSLLSICFSLDSVIPYEVGVSGSQKVCSFCYSSVSSPTSLSLFSSLFSCHLPADLFQIATLCSFDVFILFLRQKHPMSSTLFVSLSVFTTTASTLSLCLSHSLLVTFLCLIALIYVFYIIYEPVN